MDNGQVLVDRYKSRDGINRQRFREACALSSSIQGLNGTIKSYFKNHWWYIKKFKSFGETATKFFYLLQTYEEQLFKLNTFKDILENLYSISSKISGKGLAATFDYDIACGIAYHNKVNIDMVYLNNKKTQGAFKNFLKDDYTKYCYKYKTHHCFNKSDLPEILNSLDEDEIEDFICINAEIFKELNWHKKEK